MVVPHQSSAAIGAPLMVGCCNGPTVLPSGYDIITSCTCRRSQVAAILSAHGGECPDPTLTPHLSGRHHLPRLKHSWQSSSPTFDVHHKQPNAINIRPHAVSDASNNSVARYQGVIISYILCLAPRPALALRARGLSLHGPLFLFLPILSLSSFPATFRAPQHLQPAQL